MPNINQLISHCHNDTIDFVIVVRCVITPETLGFTFQVFSVVAVSVILKNI